MRILLMADSFGATGGGEIMVGYLARELSRRHEVAILSAGSGPTTQASWQGIPLFHIESHYSPRLRPIRSLVNPTVLRETRRAIEAFKPTVVHAWNVHHHLSYAALWAAHALRIPVVHTSQDALAFCYTKFHCWIDPTDRAAGEAEPRAFPQSCRNCRHLFWTFPPRNRIIQAFLHRYVTHPVAVSHALARALEVNGLPRATVIHNGLPAAEFQAGADLAQRTRGQYDLGAGRVILAGGRLGHFKGHEKTLETFAVVAGSYPEAVLAMMGEPSWYSERLAQRAGEFGIQDRVRFTGLVPREHIPSLLATASVVVNLSMYLDPFPTMNLEAMAASRPVLGTCFGGTPEAVADSLTGYIVNPYDTETSAARLSALLDSPRLAEQMGQSARERLLERFTVERMADQYGVIYQSPPA